MKDHSFDEVINLDQSLHQLAFYEVTNGLIVVPKSQEQLCEIEEKAAHKFNYFKKQIQSGECTYDFIKWSVLDKNGPFYQERNDSPTSIKNWEDEYELLKENNKYESKEKLFNFIDELMEGKNFEDIMNFKVEPLKEPTKIPPKITLDSIKNSRKKNKKKEE